jgi:acetyl-CoA carboxylase biotin carboxyl carrier protein
MAKMQVDKGLIRDLAALLDETHLTEIEIEEGDRRIRVVRAGSGAAGPVHYAPPPAAALAPVEVLAEPAHDKANLVASPMVGTAYLSPEPDLPAFVQVGDVVKEGQTLLIVEAMKVMNPIPAPKGGTIKKIMVVDAQPIEFGEPLMIIE